MNRLPAIDPDQGTEILAEFGLVGPVLAHERPGGFVFGKGRVLEYVEVPFAVEKHSVDELTLAHVEAHVRDGVDRQGNRFLG